MKNPDSPSSNIDSKPVNYMVRPYQKEAIGATVQHTNSLIRQSLEREDTPVFDTAALLEMATGSGKTFTVGQYLERIITIRDRFNRRYHVKNFQWLNILVLTNRIDGLNQFRDDLVHGKTWEKPKAPIIWESIRENFSVKTFHSKADNLSDIDESYFTRDESDEDEIFSKQNGRIKDNLSFSTFQTAIRKDLAYKMKDIDLIIIDEAHNVKPGDEYSSLLEELVTLGRDGHAPMILAVTATPTNLTKDLFGEAISKFGLAQYIASEFSPDIQYNLVSATNASAVQIQSIKDKGEIAKQEHNPTIKKQLVREIEQDFDNIMASYPGIDDLVHDLLHTRIGANPETVGQTVIFANNIQEADEITETINRQYGTTVALAYHSQNDGTYRVPYSDTPQTGLQRLGYTDDPIQILVCVDKLNESVDVPTIANVVFWRGTDVAKIFLQQFGRWLHGDNTVNYYDYIWGLRNFAWIWEIYDEWKKIINKSSTGDWSEWSSVWFKLFWGNTGWIDNHIDLSDLGFSIVELANQVKSIGVATASQLRSLWKAGIITKDLLPWDKWQEFSKSWNRENSNIGYTLPTSRSGLISILDWNTKISTATQYIISLLDDIEFIEEKFVTASQLRSLWKAETITREMLSQSKWLDFATSWNKNNQSIWYIFPISIGWLISILDGDKEIATSVQYILSLLDEREYIEKKIATASQIRSLWKDGIIREDILIQYKWKEFIQYWYTENPEIEYRLPTSISGLIGILGWDRKFSISTKYIVSLLNERKWNEIITPTQLRFLWKDRKIPKEVFSGRKWKNFAKSWNRENADIWYLLPHSVDTIISILDGNSKISSSTPYIISLLDETEFIEDKFATASQIRSIWKDGIIKEGALIQANWSEFAKSWNRNNPNIGYTLPISILGLISNLGGDKQIATSVQYIVSLLNEIEFKREQKLITIATASQIRSLWKDGIIREEILSGKKWSEFAKSWNRENLDMKYTLPLSTIGLINALEGDTKISFSTQYIRSLLDETKFIQK